MRLLRLGSSGSLTDLLEKAGNYDILFQDSLGGRCEFNARLTPNGTFNGFVRLKPDFLAYEVHAPHPRLKYLYTFISTLRIIRKRKINLIHSNDPFMYGLLLCVAAKLSGLKCCVSVHSDYEKRESLQPGAMPRVFGSLNWTRRIERWVYKLADRVFPIRESMRPHLLRQGCDPAKIRIFRHGMDLVSFNSPPAFPVRERLGLPDDTILISSACRLVEDNYARDLYRAARRLTALTPRVRVVLCGDGPELPRLRKQAMADGLSDRVLLPGFVDQETVAEMRKQSLVNLCLMGGFSLIEACASGRPTIAYDVEWHGELIEDSENGWLVREGDVDRIGAIVADMLEHPDKAKRIGDQGRRTAVRIHSLDAVNADKAELYAELTGWPIFREEPTNG